MRMVQSSEFSNILSKIINPIVYKGNYIVEKMKYSPLLGMAIGLAACSSPQKHIDAQFLYTEIINSKTYQEGIAYHFIDNDPFKEFRKITLIDEGFDGKLDKISIEGIEIKDEDTIRRYSPLFKSIQKEGKRQ